MSPLITILHYVHSDMSMKIQRLLRSIPATVNSLNLIKKKYQNHLKWGIFYKVNKTKLVKHFKLKTKKSDK